MATKHDEFKVYNFLFTGGELDVIVESLFAAGNIELGEDILEEIDAVDEPTEISSLSFDIDTSAVTEATAAIETLKIAVDALADSYHQLNEAIKGPVEYSCIDKTDALIKKMLAGVKV